jgi:hypothetical protein
MFRLAYILFFFQYCDFKMLENFPIIWDFKKKLHMKNKNVELVPILFESHCEYSHKNHLSWDSCAQRFILINIIFELFDIK